MQHCRWKKGVGADSGQTWWTGVHAWRLGGVRPCMNAARCNTRSQHVGLAHGTCHHVALSASPTQCMCTRFSSFARMYVRMREHTH